MRCLTMIVMALSFAACSSSSSTPVDAGTTEMDAGTDAPTACTTLGYMGAMVTPAAAAGDAPTATGGTLAAGTYHLTSYRVYNNTVDPSKAGTLQASIKFAAGAYEIAFMSSVDGEAKESGTVMTTGATLQFTMTCPQAMTEGQRRYSATATSFDLYDVSDSKAGTPTEVATYTLD